MSQSNKKKKRPSVGELLGLGAGTPAIAAFTDTRWQMVLQMVADLLELRGEAGAEDGPSAPLRECADAILGGVGSGGGSGQVRLELGGEGLRVTGARAIAPYLRACSSVEELWLVAGKGNTGTADGKKAAGADDDAAAFDREAYAIIDEAVCAARDSSSGSSSSGLAGYSVDLSAAGVRSKEASEAQLARAAMGRPFSVVVVAAAGIGVGASVSVSVNIHASG